MGTTFYTKIIRTDIQSTSYLKETLALLEKSSVDPLFNNPILHSNWWSIWGEEGFKLALISVNSKDGMLSLFPLYTDRLRVKGIIEIKRLQFIGTNYQHISTPRIEYLDFISTNQSELEKKLILESLCTLEWDDLILRDILEVGVTTRLLLSFAQQKKWLVRTIHKDMAYSINCNGSFSDYLASRGKNTRLKLYNRRKLLVKLGEVKFENYFPERVDDFFILMAEFHAKRWGDTFSGKTLTFHKQLIVELSEAGAIVSLSVMTVDYTVQSILYDIQYKGKVYNIQAAYNEFYHKKIALGILHLGYAIESAFNNKGIYQYDFLAGGGKNTLYKERLSTQKIRVHSLQLVRSGKLKFLYIVKDIYSSIKVQLGIKLRQDS